MFPQALPLTFPSYFLSFPSLLSHTLVASLSLLLFLRHHPHFFLFLLLLLIYLFSLSLSRCPLFPFIYFFLSPLPLSTSTNSEGCQIERLWPLLSPGVGGARSCQTVRRDFPLWLRLSSVIVKRSFYSCDMWKRVWRVLCEWLLVINVGIRVCHLFGIHDFFISGRDYPVADMYLRVHVLRFYIVELSVKYISLILSHAHANMYVCMFSTYLLFQRESVFMRACAEVVCMSCFMQDFMQD